MNIFGNRSIVGDYPVLDMSRDLGRLPWADFRWKYGGTFM